MRPTPTPSLQAPAGEQIQLGGLLREQRGLALGEDHDAGDELDRVRDRAQEAEQHERLVIGHVVGVHLLVGEAIGMSTDHVLGREEMIEAGALDGLRELLDEPGIVAQIGMAEGHAVAHHLLRIEGDLAQCVEQRDD